MHSPLDADPFTELRFGPLTVVYSSCALWFHNRMTGWQGEVSGQDKVTQVVAAIGALPDEVALVRLSALGSRFGADVSDTALAVLCPSLHPG